MGMVKWYSSIDMPALPRLIPNVPGSVLDILDAVLVNGFGSKPIATLTIADGVATAVVAGGHSFVAECVARIAGAAVTGGVINGEQRVLATTLNSIRFAVPGIPDQVASGTITIDMAPAGWQKMPRIDSVGAYRSTSPDASGCWMRVDNSASSFLGGSWHARVWGYESMSDSVTGLGQFPLSNQAGNGAVWALGGNDASERSYSVFADDRFMLIALASVAGRNHHVVNGFGDVVPVKPGDAFACANIATHLLAWEDSWRLTSGNLAVSSTDWSAGWCARSHTGLAGSTTMHATAMSRPMMGGGQAVSGTQNGSVVPYPNPADNGLLLSQMGLFEASPVCLRGVIPGPLWVPMVTRGAITDGVIIDGSGTFAGRRLRAIGVGNASSTDIAYLRGVLFVDLTGPWR